MYFLTDVIFIGAISNISYRDYSKSTLLKTLHPLATLIFRGVSQIMFGKHLIGKRFTEICNPLEISSFVQRYIYSSNCCVGMIMPIKRYRLANIFGAKFSEPIQIFGNFIRQILVSFDIP